MKLRLLPEASRCVQGGRPRIVLELVNDGHAEIEVPDPNDPAGWEPTYTLTGPAYPWGRTFAWRSLQGAAPPAPSARPPLTSIPAGETLRAEVPLALLGLRHAGRYTLDARLEWAGETHVADPVTFELEPPSVYSAALHADASVQRLQGARLTWAQGEDGAGGVYDSVWHLQGNAGLQRLATNVPSPRAGWAPGELVPVWANYPRTRKRLIWGAWREGDALCAAPLPVLEPARQRVEGLRHVVRPALMTENGALDVFLFTAAELVLLRFTPPPPRASPGEPWAPSAVRELWRRPLPSEVHASRAALAPASDDPTQGSADHVLLGTRQPGGVDLWHLEVSADGTAGAWEGVGLPGLELPPDSEPSLAVGLDGVAEACLLLTRPAARAPEQELVPSRVRFAPDGVSVERKHVGTATRPLVAAACAPGLRRGDRRSEWLALQADGTLLRRARPVALPRGAHLLRPLQPLLLDTLYVLAQDPGRGPVLVEPR